MTESDRPGLRGSDAGCDCRFVLITRPPKTRKAQDMNGLASGMCLAFSTARSETAHSRPHRSASPHRPGSCPFSTHEDGPSPRTRTGGLAASGGD